MCLKCVCCSTKFIMPKDSYIFYQKPRLVAWSYEMREVTERVMTKHKENCRGKHFTRTICMNCLAIVAPAYLQKVYDENDLVEDFHLDYYKFALHPLLRSLEAAPPYNLWSNPPSFKTTKFFMEQYYSLYGMERVGPLEDL